MLQWISKCAVIAALFLSANMLAIPHTESLGANAEVGAVGGTPGTPGTPDLHPKVLACLPSIDCPTCVPYTSCPACPSYHEDGLAWCECEGGIDGCVQQKPRRTCIPVCAIEDPECEDDYQKLPCGKQVTPEYTIDGGVCENDGCIEDFVPCTDCKAKSGLFM